jgi:O-antigen ligase
LVFSVGDAQFRFQDVIFATFLLALIFGPRETRRIVGGVALSWAGLAAALLFALAFLSLVQVPSSGLGESLVAIGKLMEFFVVGAVAGAVVVATGRFSWLLATLGVGTAVNAAVSFWRVFEAEGVNGVFDSRADGLLGQDILATGGAVVALTGFGLLASRHTNRRPSIALIAAGVLAMVAGKSILAVGAFVIGALTLVLLVRRPPKLAAVLVGAALAIGVVGARQSDVVAATRVWDSRSLPQRAKARTAAPPPVNLVANSGCEATTAGWNPNGESVQHRRVTTHRSFGASSCEVRTPGRTHGEGIFHNPVEVWPARVYSISASVRARAGTRLALRMEWLGTLRQFLSGPTKEFATSGRWQRISLVNATSPSNAAWARPSLYTAGKAQAATFQVDGIQLEQGSAATPYSLDNTEPPKNLLVNDGFESGVVGWNTNGLGVMHQRSTTEHRFGAAADEVATPGRSASEGIFHNRIAVTPGTLYSTSAWVKTESSGVFELRIEFLDEAGRFISVPYLEFGGTRNWRHVFLRNRRAPSTAALARTAVYTVRAHRPQALTFYVDGASFEANETSVAQQDYAGGSVAHRLIVSYIGARIALDHPLTGVGWLRGSQPEFMAAPKYEREARRFFPNVDPAFYPSRLPTHSHSAYLQTAADAGIPALLAFVGILVAALGAAVRAASRARGDQALYGGIAGAMLAAVAFWLNSNPLFGGSLEVGLLSCAAGMSVALALDAGVGHEQSR